MQQKDWSSRIIVGITGNKTIHWQSKLSEIEKYKIIKAALFLECFKQSQRQKIYQALLGSAIKSIPLVHIRNDMTRQELKFLSENFGSQYFTIHEDSFKALAKWRGYYKKLFLELNTDNFVSEIVDVEKIGGFCVDLSHFKAAEQKWSHEFTYIISQNNKNNKKIKKNKQFLFACNHLNGYSYKKNTDLHTVNSFQDFDYLKTIPKFLFGQVIALECNNSITEQLKFKQYLVKMLNTIHRI